MNFLNGKIAPEGVEIAGLKQLVPTDLAKGRSGQGVTVGLRPEHLVIDNTGDALTVDLVESLGGVSYAYLFTGQGERIVVEERGDERVKEGQCVGLTFAPQRLYLFDPETEQRIRD